MYENGVQKMRWAIVLTMCENCAECVLMLGGRTVIVQSSGSGLCSTFQNQRDNPNRISPTAPHRKWAHRWTGSNHHTYCGAADSVHNCKSRVLPYDKGAEVSAQTCSGAYCFTTIQSSSLRWDRGTNISRQHNAIASKKRGHGHKGSEVNIKKATNRTQATKHNQMNTQKMRQHFAFALTWCLHNFPGHFWRECLCVRVSVRHCDGMPDGECVWTGSLGTE